MATQTVKIRCSELLLRRLDGLAEAHGGNRSQAIRSAVLAASLPEGTPPVPDHNELMRLLGELARMGSLPAIRLLLAEQRRRPAEADPFAEFEPNPLERLAARRRTRASA